MSEKQQASAPAASWITDEEIIRPHSEGASQYRYRAPYAEALFERLAERLPLSSDMQVLDLCCGSGQLASSLARRVAKVVAVDGAQGMIDAATAHPGIRYVCHDINQLPLPAVVADANYQHLFLGRAIPYVRSPALAILIERCLQPGGAIVVCGAGFNPEIPWVADFSRLRGSYARVRGDFVGAAKLAGLDFYEIQRVLVKQHITCTPDFLVAHALSYSLTQQRIASDMPRFLSLLRQIVAPHMQDGQLHAEVLSWALVYRHRAGPLPADTEQDAIYRSMPLPL